MARPSMATSMLAENMFMRKPTVASEEMARLDAELKESASKDTKSPNMHTATQGRRMPSVRHVQPSMMGAMRGLKLQGRDAIALNVDSRLSAMRF